VDEMGDGMVSIKELLQKALENGASDIHLTVGFPPKIRVNGSLIEMEYQSLLPEDTERMVQYIINERQKEKLEEKGEVSFSFSVPQTGRCRASVFSQRGFYSIVLHLIKEEIPDRKELRIPSAVMELCQKKRGLILVTGSTGSGKSTTLAALLHQINEKNSVHIITLESPVEYLYPQGKAIINQREIGTDSKSYADALRETQKEDADVILVGEMREAETMEAAIEAAETGHLVIASLNVVGAVNTIERIIYAFLPEQRHQIRLRLASVLKAIISQQLIPTLKGKQMAVFEVMGVNAEIREAICEEKTGQIEAMMQMEKKQGMQTMEEAIYELYVQGEIDREQALEYALSGSEFEKKLI